MNSTVVRDQNFTNLAFEDKPPSMAKPRSMAINAAHQRAYKKKEMKWHHTSETDDRCRPVSSKPDIRVTRSTTRIWSDYASAWPSAWLSQNLAFAFFKKILRTKALKPKQIHRHFE